MPVRDSNVADCALGPILVRNLSVGADTPAKFYFFCVQAGAARTAPSPLIRARLHPSRHLLALTKHPALPAIPSRLGQTARPHLLVQGKPRLHPLPRNRLFNPAQAAAETNPVPRRTGHFPALAVASACVESDQISHQTDAKVPQMHDYSAPSPLEPKLAFAARLR